MGGWGWGVSGGGAAKISRQSRFTRGRRPRSPSLPLSPDGVDAGGAALALGLGDAVPLEGESPVEAADHGLVRLHVELEGVPVDGVDDGAHDGAGVLADPEGWAESGGGGVKLRNV